MDIIDFHAHIYPPKIAEKAVRAIGDFYTIKMDTDGTPDALLRECKKAGVSRCLVQSVATSAAQVEKINDFVAEQCRLHPEFIGFGTMHADFEDPEKEISRMIAMGLQGIKIHPDTQRFNMDDPRVMRIYEIAEGKLPVLIHCGDYRYDFSHPHRLQNVVDTFPKLTVIAAHFGGWSIWDLAMEYMLDRGCYMDCSSSLMYLGSVRSREIIRAYGADKILFGTDFPMWTHTDELKRVDALGLTEKELELILSGNAKKILREHENA